MVGVSASIDIMGSFFRAGFGEDIGWIRVFRLLSIFAIEDFGSKGGFGSSLSI